MAVLQKNDGEQTPTLRSPTSTARSPSSATSTHECADFEPYLEAGKPVINAEYKLKNDPLLRSRRSAGIVGARFNLALNGKRFEPCW